MKDSLKWIGGGVLGVAVALGGVTGIGYAAGVELGGSRAAHAPQAPTVTEPRSLAPIPSPLDREELVRTHMPTELPPPVAPPMPRLLASPSIWPASGIDRSHWGGRIPPSAVAIRQEPHHLPLLRLGPTLADPRVASSRTRV